MKFEPLTVVTLGDDEYKVEDLPDHTQRKVEIYDDIRRSAEKARLEVIKCDAALRDLGAQIASDINAANTVVEDAANEEEPADADVVDIVEAEE